MEDNEGHYSVTKEVTFGAGGGGRARIWFDELPDAQSACTQSMQQRHRVDGTRAGTSRRAAAIEILWFTGGQTLYGLLGATFIPQQSSEVNVTVCYDSGLGPEFGRPLAFGHDDCRIGLLPEFVPAIAATVSLHPQALTELGGGDLRFDHAVHGRISSASVVFQSLTSIVLRLLTAPRPPDDDAIVGMIRHPWPGSHIQRDEHSS